ncbi:polysaccharide pyruvyl transferase family protein [Agromyces soli]
MSRPIGNLLFDSISRNTGDIAIGIAAEQMLEAVGLGSRTVDPFSDTFPAPLIIGGGELIRPAGDPFYDSYRRQGPHILNAVGVWNSCEDLDYLKDYIFVSARSEREAETLRRFVPDVTVLPCTTTMLTGVPYKIDGIEPGETVVGIHVVPHSLRLIEDLIPLIDAIPHKKVFIPFTHYNGDASFMRNMPFDRSNSIVLGHLKPLELHSVLGQMSYSVVSSLHASIFSYSQNVPFVSLHQKKAEWYFADRALADNIVSSGARLREQIDRIESERPDYSMQIHRDQESVRAAYALYSQLYHAAPRDEWVPMQTPPTPKRDEILLEQAEHVIRDRDLALSYSQTRLANVQHERAELSAHLKVVADERDALRRMPSVRLVLGVRRRLDSLRRRIRSAIRRD